MRGTILTFSVFGLITFTIPFNMLGQPVSLYSPGIANMIINPVSKSTDAYQLSNQYELGFDFQQRMSRREKRRTLRGGLIGLAIGGVTGGLLGITFYQEKNDCGFFVACSRSEAFVNNAIFGGAVGGIAGLIIGNLTYEDRWNPQFRMSGIPGPRGRLAPQVGIQMKIGK